MINTLKITADQVQLCKDIMVYFKNKSEVEPTVKERYAKGLFRRTELLEANQQLRQKVCCPACITKNVMAKASAKEGASLYNVQKFIDHAAKFPPEVKSTKPEKKTVKKEATAAKKEAPKKTEKKTETKKVPAKMTAKSKKPPVVVTESEEPEEIISAKPLETEVE